MNKSLLIFIVFGLILSVFALKKVRPGSILLSAVSGTAAFLAADWLGSFFSFGLPLNAFTFSVSALGGIPGVILITLLQAFLSVF